MTETLPTIIGMAVVSQTVQTTFGKGRGGRKRVKREKYKIYRGSRGGKYILKRGKRIYI